MKRPRGERRDHTRTGAGVPALEPDSRRCHTGEQEQEKRKADDTQLPGRLQVERVRVAGRVGPVRNLRFTQSYLEALAGTVAVARERKVLKGFLGGTVVPAIRIVTR